MCHSWATPRQDMIESHSSWEEPLLPEIMLQPEM